MTPSAVTEHLVSLIAKQVGANVLVVWYDPEQAYGSAAAELRLPLPKTTLPRIGGSDVKLRRAANLHLEPDLNDGVVLNIAPLWELVPWKEANNYWDELLEGKSEWSSTAKPLHQTGLVS